MARARKHETDEEAEERRAREAVRQGFFDEEYRKPMRYFKHDTNACDDPKLQDLRDEYGFEAYGRWWLLVEHLAGRVNHCYDVSRENGWRRLARDLEFDRGTSGIDQCREFIATLYGLGLISRQSYDEFEHVRSVRLDRNAEEYAEGVAGKKFAAWSRWRKDRDGQ